MKVLDTARNMLGGSGYERIDDLSPISPIDESNEGYGAVKSIIRESRKIPVDVPTTWSAWTFTWFQPIITLGEKKVITRRLLIDERVV